MLLAALRHRLCCRSWAWQIFYRESAVVLRFEALLRRRSAEDALFAAFFGQFFEAGGFAVGNAEASRHFGDGNQPILLPHFEALKNRRQIRVDDDAFAVAQSSAGAVDQRQVMVERHQRQHVAVVQGAQPVGCFRFLAFTGGNLAELVKPGHVVDRQNFGQPGQVGQIQLGITGIDSGLNTGIITFLRRRGEAGADRIEVDILQL